jgi:nitrite reductase/ring-hydroxylating ferredoxin subunit
MSCGETLTQSPISNTQYPTRRGFLSLLTKGTLFAAFGGLLYQAARFFSADVSTQPPHLFMLQRPANYAPGTFTFEQVARVYVGRDARGLFAINATCTHLGCTVKHVKGALTPTQFECPCHGSQFDGEGRVITGPATGALERVRLTLASDGRVIVDRTAIVNVDFRLAV